MKLKLHNVNDQLDSELDGEFNNYEFDKGKNKFVYCSKPRHEPCLYEGTDLLSHEIKGECIHCDYDRVNEREKQMNLHWLDKTEYWDYYNWWEEKYQIK